MGIKVSQMIVSKFLKKDDFPNDQVCTIKGLRQEEVSDREERWVLYFAERDKGLVLNSTTIKVLEKAFGDDSDNWIGKRVKVYVDPNVSFQGQVVGGLRLMPPRTTQAAAPPPPKPAADDGFGDEIPFN